MRTSIAAIAAAMIGAGLLGAAPAAAQGRPDTRGEPQRGIVTHVETVSDLAAVCDPRWGGVPRLEAIAYCQGYLTAAVQYHALTRPPRGRVQPLFCVPGRGPSVAESGVGFAQWAGQNPRYANEPALDGFLRWAQLRFPCRPASPRGNR